MKGLLFKYFLLAFVLNMGINTLAKEKNTFVKIETNYGTLKVMLYDETPLHRDNFLKLVKENFFDSLLFHRVIPNFMIQAGDPTSKNASIDTHLGAGGVGYTIPAEIIFPKYYHKRGALAAARTGDFVNPNRESSGSQFYIVEGRPCTDDDLDILEQNINKTMQQTLFNKMFAEKKAELLALDLDSSAYNMELRKIYNELRQEVTAVSEFRYTDAQRREYKMFGGTPHLDGQYTVFGELVEGFSVLETISKVETNKEDRPLENVVIINTKIVKK
jgi:cyclophilin family peptidyl-prolyl cis-trans isomerase